MLTMLALLRDVPPATDPTVPVLDWFQLLDGSALGTYIGIAAVTAVLVEFLKKAIKAGPLDGHEQFTAILIAPALGAGAKMITAAYADIAWTPHIIILAIVGASVAGWIHDQLMNPLIGGVKVMFMKKAPEPPK